MVLHMRARVCVSLSSLLGFYFSYLDSDGGTYGLKAVVSELAVFVCSACVDLSFFGEYGGVV